MGGIPYSAAECEWVRENYKAFATTQEATDAFNARFHASRTRTAIRLLAKREGVADEYKPYTEEENAWLMENYPKHRPPETLSMFLERFNHPTSITAFKAHCNSILGLKSVESGSFQKGRLPHNTKSLGMEHRHANGYLFVKVDDVAGEKGNPLTYRHNWKLKQRVVWEQHHGPVPPNHQIIFLDGDKENYSIDNLCCIPIKFMSIMNRNGWVAGNKEVTLAAIKWCYLHYALEEIDCDD